ncbi:hypothetical protein K488DRAFT_67210 [Vararia minispora EC-137]|uniref:Uncharacterized protein n=1 Tax=Vararia minispora EC-137 TaxID=1314806 RepID=A0ACB8QYS8_9AGAM|nr:hypothetical protein K488DRAFT_67210 [Vararia minispora EC-137]
MFSFFPCRRSPATLCARKSSASDSAPTATRYDLRGHPPSLALCPGEQLAWSSFGATPPRTPRSVQSFLHSSDAAAPASAVRQNVQTGELESVGQGHNRASPDRRVRRDALFRPRE